MAGTAEVSGHRWTALAVLTFARTANGFQFQSVGAVSPLLMERLHIANTELGWLIGFFSLPGVFLALPGGLLGGRFGDRRVVLAGLGLMTVGSALMGAAEGFAAVVVGRLLSAVGASLVKAVRKSDLAARLGGDEFALFLAGSDESSARIIAERAAALVGEHLRQLVDLPVGISIGIAMHSSGVSAKQVIAAADRAMYAAKREGGGRIAFAAP
jgi:MFS family permease